MRFQRRHDLTGTEAQRFLKGISRISGLAEVEEDSAARIWIRGEPHCVQEFLSRVYGAAKVEEDAGEGEGDAVEKGGEKGEKGENGGESI